MPGDIHIKTGADWRLLWVRRKSKKRKEQKLKSNL